MVHNDMKGGKNGQKGSKLRAAHAVPAAAGKKVTQMGKEGSENGLKRGITVSGNQAVAVPLV